MHADESANPNYLCGIRGSTVQETRRGHVSLFFYQAKVPGHLTAIIAYCVVGAYSTLGTSALRTFQFVFGSGAERSDISQTLLPGYGTSKAHPPSRCYPTPPGAWPQDSTRSPGQAAKTVRYGRLRQAVSSQRL